jgi:putative ABC transport system permease protein
MQLISQDLHYAVRTLLRAPATTAASLLTLGLGVGAATTLYAAVHSLVLRPLEFPAPEQLVILSQVRDAVPGEVRQDTMPWWSYPRLEAVRTGTAAFSGMAGFGVREMNLSGGTEPLRGTVELVSHDYFRLLGQGTPLGRWFSARESEPGAPLTAVISDALWRSIFAARQDVLGQTLELNGRPATIIGVLPVGFSGLSARTDVWIPLGSAETLLFPGALTDPGSNWFGVVARLHPGVTLAAAREQVRRVGERFSDTFGGSASALVLPFEMVRIEPRARRAVLILFGATILVLLIATANIANLQLVRGARRGQEMGIRLALGASRRRLLRQLLTEGAVLSLLGAGVGCIFALWGTALIASLGSVVGVQSAYSHATLATFDAVSVNAPTLFFGLLLAGLTTLLFGLWPALRTTDRDPAAMLGAERHTSRTRHRAGRVLVGFEVALALVLLASAGLMLRSVANLRAVDTGIHAQDVLTFRITTVARPGESLDRPALYRQITETVALLPGVRAAGLSRCLPLSGECDVVFLTRMGDQHFTLADSRRVTAHSADAGYFDALGIGVVDGRGFREQDAVGTPKVVVVNRAFVTAYAGGSSPVGRRLTVSWGFLDWRNSGETAEIVGVVDDVRYANPEEYLAQPAVQPAVYAPVAQYPVSSYYVVVAGSRGTPRLAQVNTALGGVAPHLPLYDVRGMEARLADATARYRLLSVFLTMFAALAALLASIGVYGVLSYVVAGRTREIGVRKALGASPASLVRSMVTDGLRPVAAGLAVGLPVFLISGRALRPLLAAVSAADPLIVSVAGFILATTALVACLIPALRAARADPAVALRAD